MGLGKTLKKARENQNFSLKELSVITKIPVKHLRNLEKEQWQRLPSACYVRGYLLKIAGCLKLSSKKALSLFDQSLPKRTFLEKPRPKSRFSLRSFLGGRPRVFGALIGLGLSLIVGYLAFEAWQLLEGPDLVLADPPSDMIVSEGEIVLRGKSSLQAEVFINGEKVFLDRQGAFEIAFQLKPGLNIIEIIAQDQFNHQKVLHRRIVWR